jgi:probable F420-dependent oxidoreductase
MRFSITMPIPDGEFLWKDALVEVAQRIESAGLGSCALPDHPFPAPDPGGRNTQWLDPFVLLGAFAAATARLRLETRLVVLPYRNPFLVARAVSTLDHVSGGRVILGVGAGFSRGEFASLGVDFEERNELVEESLEAMKRAWTGEEIRMEGRHWKAEGNVMLPRPLTAPHPPIWMGGNSTRAIERAVRSCQGWIPVETPAAHARQLGTVPIDGIGALEQRMQLLGELRERHGREEPFDVCFARQPTNWPAASDDQTVDEIGRLGELGVTWIGTRFTGADTAELFERIDAFGELVATIPEVAQA